MSQASPNSAALPPSSSPRGSPPPYSPNPPAFDAGLPTLARRAASSPHLHSPPQSPQLSHIYPQSSANSRRPSASGLPSQVRCRLRSQSANARAETDDEDTDTALSGDDTIVYRARSRERLRERAQQQSRPWSLRERLFGKGGGRADAAERARLISTARGVAGAGETETESDDAVSIHISRIKMNCRMHAACVERCGSPSPMTVAVALRACVTSGAPSFKMSDFLMCVHPQSYSFLLPFILPVAQPTHCAFDTPLRAVHIHLLSAYRVHVDTHTHK